MSIDIIIPAIDPDVAHEAARVALANAGAPASVHVIHDEDRDGFTKTVNRGLRTTVDAGHDVLLMNDDIRPVTDDWLAKLVQVMTDKQQAGVKCGFVGPSGACRTRPICDGKPEWAIEGAPHRLPVKVSYHPFFCTLVSRRCLDVVGLLDEAFIFYGSDQDLQWRAQQLGWGTWWVPTVYVDHEVSGWTTRHPEHEDQRKAWRRQDQATLDRKYAR